MANDDIAYYAGSRAFSWLSDLTGLKIDQVNFILCQSVALLLGFLLRTQLHPSKASAQLRHVYSFSFGLGMLYFCFGYHIYHVLVQAFTCYILMLTMSPKTFQRVVMAFALVYLSTIHLMRQTYNYGSYTLDITGPLMVVTQKVTGLAFCIHDGFACKEEDLNPDQRKQAVRSMPTLLEFLSYCFHFQALMCGPMIFYNDYIAFIYGRHGPVSKNMQPAPISEKGDGTQIQCYTSPSSEPSPSAAVVKKVFLSSIFALVVLKCVPLFPIQRAMEETFVNDTPLISKMLFLMAATMFVRTKYYHAWLLSDAICNISGIGFSGYDSKGDAKWDEVSNVSAYGFEMGLSLKECVDYWNRSTGLWLRRVAYDRAPFQRTIVTYSLSAIWHGFYPGYYLTFFSGALLTVASRNCRRVIRPHFQTSESMASLYDVITFVVTKFAMAYVTFPFVLLEFWPSIRIYRSMFFFIHVFTFLVGFVFTRFIPRKSVPSANSNKTDANTTTTTTNNKSVSIAQTQNGSVANGGSKSH